MHILAILALVGCSVGPEIPSQGVLSGAVWQAEARVARLGPERPLPILSAARGEEGTFLWLTPCLAEGQRVERGFDDQWALLAGSGCSILDGDDSPSYRVVEPASGRVGDPIEPVRLALSVTSEQAGHLLLSGDRVALEVPEGSLPGDSSGFAIYVSRQQDAEVRYLESACAEDTGLEEPATCWTATRVPWQYDLAASAALHLPVLTADASTPGVVSLTVGLAGTLDDGSIVPVASDTISYVDLARRYYWGDLHGHTNLSSDGCESPDAACAPQGELPADLFYQRAVENGLDFAAKTDHAEYTRCYPDGKDGGPVLDIWQTSQDRLARAEDDLDDFVPLLGYEWTYNGSGSDEDGHLLGGHRSIVFDAAALCADFYIGFGGLANVRQAEIGTGFYVNDNPIDANDPDALWSALDDAQAVCGPVRTLAIAHHSGVGMPQPIDWGADFNTPVYDYTALVEIYSEHGCSECTDTSSDGCDWGLQDDKPAFLYEERGGVQAALAQGFRFGFTAGTDSHDGRPGSVDDGPSCISSYAGSGGQSCQSYGGGLTGVMVSGPLSRAALFDAFFARNTLATSGPMIDLRVALWDGQGRVFLPGDEVPADASPLRLRVDAEAALSAFVATPMAIEVLTPAHEYLAVSDEETLQAELCVRGGDIFYVRVRFDVDGEEERAWASPFFVVDAEGDE